MPVNEELLEFWKSGLPIAQSVASHADAVRGSFSNLTSRTLETTSRRRLTIGCVFVAVLLFTYSVLLSSAPSPSHALLSPQEQQEQHSEDELRLKVSPVQASVVDDDGDAIPAAINYLETYKSSPSCQISSLDIFKPTNPLCKDKESLMKAMMYGGRIGLDAPYQTRDCDMRWYSTSEICDILSRFSQVVLLGDSLLRNVAIVFNVFRRQDLVHGGERTWDEKVKEVDTLDCSCGGITQLTNCSWYRGAHDSDWIFNYDPASMACSKDASAAITYRFLTTSPIADFQLGFIADSLPAEKPEKPIAIVMGHGLWDNLEYNKTTAWLDEFFNTTFTTAPWMNVSWPSAFSSDSPPSLPPFATFKPPLLFTTPSAATDIKPSMFWGDQSNLKLSSLEKKVGKLLEGSGIDHLGMYNMSIQSTSWDGTHASYRTDLLKCMMILNWLDSYDVSSWTGTA